MPTQVELRNRNPAKIAIMIIANIVIIVGFFLLVRILYNAATGTLIKTIFGSSTNSSFWSISAIALSLPVPLHLISIGLIIQKKWFPPSWVKACWIAVVFSGCWLGVALFIKLFILK